MLLQKELNELNAIKERVVFSVYQNEVEEIEYLDLLNECRDQTTTPNGVGSRLFYITNLGQPCLDCDHCIDENFDKCEETFQNYTLCTWGACGNNRKELKTVDTLEEAELWLYKAYEVDLNGHCAPPTFFDTEEEAKDYLNNERQTKLIQLFEYNDIVFDYTYFLDMDEVTDFDSLSDKLSDECAFNEEVIYYYKAIEYLKEKDASLKESIEIALDYGYRLDSINSELLATLHKSEANRAAFYALKNEINEILNY